ALLLLAFLSANRLGGVFNAFALVRLGRSVGADISCYLAHSLAVSPTDGDDRRPFASYSDIRRNGKWDIMTVTELQVEGTSLDLSPIANSGDLEIDRKAGRNPCHHIVDQRPGCSPHRTRVLGIVLRRDCNRPVDDRGCDLIAEREAQRTQLPFGGQRLTSELNFDAARDGYRMFANARHRSTSEHSAQHLAANFRGAGLVV